MFSLIFLSWCTCEPIFLSSWKMEDHFFYRLIWWDFQWQTQQHHILITWVSSELYGKETSASSKQFLWDNTENPTRAIQYRPWREANSDRREGRQALYHWAMGAGRTAGDHNSHRVKCRDVSSGISRSLGQAVESGEVTGASAWLTCCDSLPLYLLLLILFS